jgi:hypothetical protein
VFVDHAKAWLAPSCRGDSAVVRFSFFFLPGIFGGARSNFSPCPVFIGRRDVCFQVPMVSRKYMIDVDSLPPAVEIRDLRAPTSFRESGTHAKMEESSPPTSYISS